MNEAVDKASLQLDELVREMQATWPGGHAAHDGWSLTGYPRRELRCVCGDTFMATCPRCGEFVRTTPSGETYSHDDSVMMVCAEDDLCTCSGVGLRTKLAMLTGETTHAADCPRG